jgi:hypothetical protein
VPDYRYTGDDARYYPSLGVDAVPAGAEGGPTVAAFEEPPTDGRWEPVPAPAKKKAPPAAPVPADSGQKEA